MSWYEQPHRIALLQSKSKHNLGCAGSIRPEPVRRCAFAGLVHSCQTNEPNPDLSAMAFGKTEHICALDRECIQVVHLQRDPACRGVH